MASVKTFIRNTPAGSLRDYFNTTGITLPTPVNWDEPEPAIIEPLLQAVDIMDDTARAQVVADAERVSKMADDAGQVALFSVTEDRDHLEQLANGHDRALWLFLNRHDAFQRAEEVRFTDERRRGRSWDGFQGRAGCTVQKDALSLDAFRDALRQQFGTQNIHVDVFERVRPTFDGEDCRLIQVVVYREGLPDSLLAFDGGKLVRRAYRPVFEAAMTYEPDTGVIEVVARDRESRAQMAKSLARDLLGFEFGGDKVPFRRFDLSVLLAPFDFPTDIEDGIELVEVRQLRLMPLDKVTRRVVLECLAKEDATIWQMAEEEFGATSPLRTGWVVTQAKIVIKFHPKGGARWGRTLPLTITMPHGCNLKDRTREEQLIGEKYLRRWGLLVDEPELVED